MRPFALLLALGLLALTGCNSVPRIDGARVGPFYTPANVRGFAELPRDVRRIVVLPCAAEGLPLTEGTLDGLDAAIRPPLLTAARAEISPLSREQLAALTGRRSFTSTSTLPHDLVAALTRATAADAVLFVDLTAYSAYPPLRIGWRARLVDLHSGELLWAFDNVFDSAETAVANSARHHFLISASATGTPADLSYTVLQSPSRFAAYTADAMWKTLPPRHP